MEKAYFTLDEDYRSIIQGALPDETVESIRLNATGWTNIVYLAVTNKGEYYFRFPRDEFWSRTIVKDYEFATYIQGKTDFPTVRLGLKRDSHGRPFSLHRKVDGVALAEVMGRMTPTQISSVSKSIADFMAELHAIDWHKDAIFDIHDIGLNLKDFLNELLEKHVSPSDMAFWKAGHVVGTPVECLVHGDLNSSNVLVDKADWSKVLCFIDFGFGGYGNKYSDIARIIGRCPASFKEPIVTEYERKTGAKLNRAELAEQIDDWNKIDTSYIHYMTKIGIYKPE